MASLKDFIVVTAMYDGRKAVIRSETIESVLDNADQSNGERIKFACRTINYAGRSIDVSESLEDICDMIYNAEL